MTRNLHLSAWRSPFAARLLPLDIPNHHTVTDMPILPLAPRPSPLHRGFTMIELLVVIAIIGIISGILVIGLKSVITHRQKDQTVAMLKRLDNAMTEITTTPAGAFKLYTIQLPSVYFPVDPTVATARYDRDSIYKNWIGVPAGALESQVRTALVLKQILSTNPSAKKFLADLPPDRQRRIAWTTTTPGSTPALNPPTGSGRTRPEYTMPLDAWGNPILFVFDGLQIPTGTNVGRPFSVNLGGTQEAFVGGLTNLIVQSDKSFYEPAQLMAPVPTPMTAANTDNPGPTPKYDRTQFDALTNTNYTAYLSHKSATGATEETLRSPDHKPFWMSAGPDGRYDTHDDNVYSFGN